MEIILNQIRLSQEFGLILNCCAASDYSQNFIFLSELHLRVVASAIDFVLKMCLESILLNHNRA